MENTQTFLYDKTWAFQYFVVKSVAPTWKDPILETINSFSHLAVGWDYGEGVPTASGVGRLASDVYSLGKLNAFSTEVLPTTEGGISVIFQRGDCFLDVTVYADLTMSARIERGIGSEYTVEMESDNVSKLDIIHLLEKTTAIYRKCSLSEPYPIANTVSVSNDSNPIVLSP